MKGQTRAAVMNGTPLTLNEEHLLREIAHFDQKALEHVRADTALGRALATVYRYSADEKREVLAALRDGAASLPARFYD